VPHKFESEEIEASALMPGFGCPFTPGCAERGGTVRILSAPGYPTILQNGKTSVLNVMQFHCPLCKCIAKGVKQVGGVAVGAPRFFNRMTGRSE